MLVQDNTALRQGSVLLSQLNTPFTMTRLSYNGNRNATTGGTLQRKNPLAL